MELLHDRNNVYAYNLKQIPIHISEAESGRKGYLCMGCNGEMQAVKSTLANRISYFRHDAKDVINRTKCTYSDESYRHKIAKEILQRIKRVKVPSLYKYPPLHTDGKAILLKESKFVIADTVGIEMNFYENDEGKVCWGSGVSFKESDLIFRPDVAFFDAFGNPILIIEIVATHKVTLDKRLKIKRLGVDAIQITIPKETPEKIEEVFSTTKRTKWIYNYEQEYTDYVPVSNGTSEEISSFDEEQRSIFEESFECRAAEIGNLIRAATRCLESQQYGDIKRSIESKIRSVEGNTEEFTKQWVELQKELRKAVERGFENESKQIRNGEIEFQKYFEDLEKRYSITKESDQASRIKFENEQEGIRRSIDDAQRRRIEIANDGQGIEHRIKLKEEEARRSNAIIEAEEKRFIEDLSRRRDGLPAKFAEQNESSLRKLEEQGRQIDEEYRDLGEQEEKLESSFITERERIERRIENVREQANRRVENRTIGGNDDFAQINESLVAFRTALQDFEEKFRTGQRYRTAWQAIKSGSYENWND
jgi:hypothetical protein